MDLSDILNIDASQLVIAHEQVGSRVTCNPPVLDTDDDRLLLVADKKEFVSLAEKGGYVTGGSFCDNNKFVSLRKGVVNLIVTSETEFWQRFLSATSICKRLNLSNKKDRIALFQAVLYGAKR